MAGEAVNRALVSGLVGPTFIAVVPEPATSLLVSLGLLALFAMGKVRAQRH